MLLSQPTRWFLTRQAARSQARRYPADFVWSVENGRDSEVSLVFDECAVNKFYYAEELPELKPYCNFFDVTYSRLMNMGVDARKTIGLWCERCALRYQHGRETTVPVKLRSIIWARMHPSSRLCATFGSYAPRNCIQTLCVEVSRRHEYLASNPGAFAVTRLSG